MGLSHSTYLIDSFNNLLVSGCNNYGQLGLGHATGQNSFKQVPNISDIRQIVSGESHTIILKKDGTVWGAGNNRYGQLGLGSVDSNPHSTFIKLPIENVKQIGCGYYHTMAIKDDNTLWVCGYNNYGQLGDGTTNNAVTFKQVSNIDNVKQVASGTHYVVVLKNDGTVYVCGYNNYGQLGLGNTTQYTSFVKNPNLTNINKIACGMGHTIFVKNDGTLLGCGYNTLGELGINNTTNQSSIVQIPNIGNVKQVVCGYYHTIVIKEDNTIWSSGCGNYGQLGNGTTGNQILFTQITSIDNVKQITCGMHSTFILKNDCTLWATGNNQYGQFGDGTISSQLTFKKINVNGIISIGDSQSNLIKITFINPTHIYHQPLVSIKAIVTPNSTKTDLYNFDNNENLKIDLNKYVTLNQGQLILNNKVDYDPDNSLNLDSGRMYIFNIPLNDFVSIKKVEVK